MSEQQNEEQRLFTALDGEDDGIFVFDEDRTVVSLQRVTVDLQNNRSIRRAQREIRALLPFDRIVQHSTL
ncbi:hypothetical protein [Methanoculleus oceani]|nr:hypothetical protein [Methanoculleus sp. CWC-02]